MINASHTTDLRQGFIVIEILVSILAMLATVALGGVQQQAYSNVQDKANDAKMQSLGSTVYKKLLVKDLMDGDVTSSNTVSTRQGVLNRYDLASMSDDLVVCSYNYSDNACSRGGGTYKKDKLYLMINSCGIAYAYWMNTQHSWVTSEVTRDSDDNLVTGKGVSVDAPQTSCSR